MQPLARPLKGIIPPLVTPLLDHDTLDKDGTRLLLDHVIEGGVSGVFLLGTTGEGPSLSCRLRRDFVRLCCDAVVGRVPVLVSVSDTSFVETVALASAAKEAGAAAVVLTAPYYFPVGQDDLISYVERVMDAVSLPLLLYNMPALTKVWFEVETLEKLSKHPKIIGIKDSSGDLEYFKKLCQLKEIRPDWTIMIGPENLTAEAIELGGDGGVNGGSNVYPRLFVSLYKAATSGQTSLVADIIKRVDALQAIYTVGTSGGRYAQGPKCALSILGICSDRMAQPFDHFSSRERAKIKAILDALPQVPLDS